MSGNSGAEGEVRRASPAPATGPDHDAAAIEGLRAEARYRRERYDLYRAKTYGLRPTTMTRLRELERAHLGAAARLRRALSEHPPERP